jgi:hypothetical protein
MINVILWVLIPAFLIAVALLVRVLHFEDVDVENDNVTLDDFPEFNNN